MKLKLLIILLFFSIGLSYAANPDQISNDLSKLTQKIDKLNKDLSKKEQQRQEIDDAIQDSNDAIDQSDELYEKLKDQRNIDADKLVQINDLLTQSNQAIEELQATVNTQVVKIYQQVNEIKQNNSSIFSGNSTEQENRKKTYLIKILQKEQQKYADLQKQLDQLNQSNQKLTDQVLELDKKLGDTKAYSKLLHQKQQQKLKQKQTLVSQIANEKSQLSDLKQKYENLNTMLAKIYLDDEKQEAIVAKTNKVKLSKGGKPSITPSQEISTSVFARKHVAPLNAQIAVGFGELRGNVNNNGILYNATNQDVYAISDARVIYSGVLPGFGQMIVLDNGDKYTSIYSGILSKVKKGQIVKVGEVIATSGISNNQPLGGVYFELRHLGKPVNPNQLIH